MDAARDNKDNWAFNNINNNCPVFIFKPALSGFFYTLKAYIIRMIINSTGENKGGTLAGVNNNV